MIHDVGATQQVVKIVLHGSLVGERCAVRGMFRLRILDQRRDGETAPVGVGSESSGEDVEHGQRVVSAEVHALGDAADVYGPHSNEQLIKEALYPYPENLVIATKGGFLRGGPEYSDMGATGNKWYLRQAAYTSMRRLCLDQIDLYYLHTPALADVPFENAAETLAGMKQDGLIRHIDLSNISAEQLVSALTITDIAAVTAHYNVAIRIGAAVRARWRKSTASSSRRGISELCQSERKAR